MNPRSTSDSSSTVTAVPLPLVPGEWFAVPAVSTAAAELAQAWADLNALVERQQAAYGYKVAREVEAVAAALAYTAQMDALARLAAVAVALVPEHQHTLVVDRRQERDANGIDSPATP